MLLDSSLQRKPAFAVIRKSIEFSICGVDTRLRHDPLAWTACLDSRWHAIQPRHWILYCAFGFYAGKYKRRRLRNNPIVYEVLLHEGVARPCGCGIHFCHIHSTPGVHHGEPFQHSSPNGYATLRPILGWLYSKPEMLVLNKLPSPLENSSRSDLPNHHLCL